MEGNHNISSEALLNDLALLEPGGANAFARIVRGVLSGFDKIEIDSIHQHADLRSTGRNGSSDVSFTVLKDILRNFATGRGSILELIQYGLAAECAEYLSLFLDGSISFETLYVQVCEVFDLKSEEHKVPFP